MKKFVKVIPLFLFAIFIWGFSILDAVAPRRDFSDLENRNLAQYKAPTIKTLLSGDFVSNYEKYVNDQFVFRENWITLKSIGETIYLKTENNNIVYGKDHYMFDKVLTVDETRKTSNFEYVMEFAEKHKDTKVSFSLVPSASSVLEEYLPIGLELPDQFEMINALYDQANNSNLQTVDVGSALQKAHAESDELLYYRTDHHWTRFGATITRDTFLGQPSNYSAIAQLPVETVPNFYGTHYSKAKKVGTIPDVIEYTNYPISSLFVDGEEKDTLHDLEQFNKRDKYAGLVWSNHGITTINGKDFEKKETPTRILIVKDSYGNTLAPLFLEHYDQVVMVDLRYTADIEELLNTTKFDDIYIIYSFPNFTTDTNIIKLVP